jgi:anti-sigma-K factor RskA
MNSAQKTSSNDLLIAEYTLGLLDLKDTAQAQALLGSDPKAVVKALGWENAFLALVDQLTPVQPPPQLLQRIQEALGLEVSPIAPPVVADAADEVFHILKTPSSTPPVTQVARREAAHRPPVSEPGRLKDLIGLIYGSVWFWRTLCAILALIMLVLALRLNKLQPIAAAAAQSATAELAAPATVQLAILQAPGQTSTPGWTATLDTQHNLLLTPLVHSEIPPDASVQLWTSNDTERQPRSLGIIDPNQAVAVPAATLGAIQAGQLFEMTLEEQGGSASGSPKGAILFIGRMVKLN